MHIHGFYVPVFGIEADFDEAVVDMPRKLVPTWGSEILLSRNTHPKRATKLKRKHLADSANSPEIPKFCDWELCIPGDNFEYFDGDIVHGIAFCILMRKTCCLHFPIWSTSSTINPIDENDVCCGDVLPGEPLFYLDSKKLNLEDVEWISKNLPAVLSLMGNARFQNAMQALNAYQYIPAANFNFLVSWTGIEALFGISQEISFRISLLLAKYLVDEQPERLRQKMYKGSYDLRSKVAHGSSTKARVQTEQSIFARQTLARCLMRVVENGEPPDEETILFGS
ncbi:hypothetical protein EOA13_14365 [Mesorhizobium sp. M7A.F.Ca.US.011.01.1.1]|uniref:HEPN domain-containing protein n=1 Tax=Mesorhizobium sp. M7A.F.Ca.US.011.01.1.1 TaxID=2496741 RepID=UPI000FCBB59C|nr:HEPN domain-containing protein [Mesorhizobium sp. M7A.F.Ca.US.011.01.1.1]RUX29268.1 hypothetical protein EOA13_14365 [Mesorhizobium sp. M7A.F.Ca.US.011.01.1.1]